MPDERMERRKAPTDPVPQLEVTVAMGAVPLVLWALVLVEAAQLLVAVLR